MRFLATSNHGNTINPKEGADVRRHNLVTELARNHLVTLLESDRYYGEIHPPGNVSIRHYREFYFEGNPLSPFLDLNPSFVSKMWKLVENHDLIQVSFPPGILATRAILSIRRRKIPLVYDAHNVEGDLADEVGQKVSRIANSLLTALTKIQEMVAVKCADHVIAVSHKDAGRFQEKYAMPASKISVIPSGARLTRIDEKKRQRLRDSMRLGKDDVVVAFHGTFFSDANREAVDMIRHFIAPRFVGDAHFLIGGTGGSEFRDKNITCIGRIEDLDAFLSASDIALVPLRRGGGTKLKILDYLSAGLPIITTVKGAEGIDIVNLEHAIVVEYNEKEICDAVRRLISAPMECQRLGENAKNLANDAYNWRRIGENLRSLNEELISNENTDDK